jgi:hypothetical protein
MSFEVVRRQAPTESGADPAIPSDVSRRGDAHAAMLTLMVLTLISPSRSAG